MGLKKQLSCLWAFRSTLIIVLTPIVCLIIPLNFPGKVSAETPLIYNRKHLNNHLLLIITGRKMRVRNRHHGGVLDDRSDSDGGHSSLPHHALPLPRRSQLQRTLRQLSQGKQNLPTHPRDKPEAYVTCLIDLES